MHKLCYLCSDIFMLSFFDYFFFSVFSLHFWFSICRRKHGLITHDRAQHQCKVTAEGMIAAE